MFQWKQTPLFFLFYRRCNLHFHWRFVFILIRVSFYLFNYLIRSESPAGEFSFTRETQVIANTFLGWWRIFMTREKICLQIFVNLISQGGRALGCVSRGIAALHEVRAGGTAANSIEREFAIKFSSGLPVSSNIHQHAQKNTIDKRHFTLSQHLRISRRRSP